MIRKFDNEQEAKKFFEENEKNNVPKDIPDNSDEDVTIIELEGEYFEIIDTVNIEGRNFVALTPYNEEDKGQDDDEYEFSILEIFDDPDDELNCILKTVDDEETYDRVGDEFIRRSAQFDEENE